MNPPKTTWPACPSERLAPLIPERARKSGIETLEAYCDFIDIEATGHLSGDNSHRRKRRPLTFIDDRGEVVVKVPLDRTGARWATADATRWFDLQEGGANNTWRLIDNGRGNLSVKTYPSLAGRSRPHVPVAKLLLGTSAIGPVRPLNGDPTDLRVFNLQSSPKAYPREAGRRDAAWTKVRRGAARRSKTRSEGRHYDPKGSKE